MEDMNSLKIRILFLLVLASSIAFGQSNDIHLTLIPPDQITDKVDLDIRVGIKNQKSEVEQLKVEIYLDKIHINKRIYTKEVSIAAGAGLEIKQVIPKGSLSGKHKVILTVHDGSKFYKKEKAITVVPARIRSTQTIDGAWVGLYHWSEIEGKHWNQDIKHLKPDDWKKVIRGMNKLNMNMVVIQEVFRSEAYAGKHQLTVDNFPGKAFYPSDLYPSRMDIATKDPIEVILSEADKLNMNVWLGVGLFAWFDFTETSLIWHKNVAKELWDKYGHHPSFYGFYVSEEMGGSLDNWETTEEGQKNKKREIVDFFREFKSYCTTIAPGKPLMLATNSMEVPKGADTYPELLKYLDVLCPFGFARMPDTDISGKEAADLLQQFCDQAGSHLWFDLEAFLFNEDTSLYPRDLEGIKRDLNLFSNFEKILCYQYPGVFNDPKSGLVIGDQATLSLFEGYLKYQKNKRKELTKKSKK